MDITRFLASYHDDKYPNNFQFSLPNLQARLELADLREKFKSTYNSGLIEPCAFQSFHQEDGSTIRNPDDFLFQDLQAQNLPSPMDDYAKDYFQTCRAHGLNFCEAKAHMDKEDFLSPTYPEFWGCNEDREVIGRQNEMIENIQPNVNNHRSSQAAGTQGMKSIVLPSFEPWNPLMTFNHSKVDSSLSESTNACDNTFCHSPVQLRNQRRKSHTTQPKAKKKRKVEGNDVKQENIGMSPPSCLRLKKSKSEFSQNAFPIGTGVNLLNLQIDTPISNIAYNNSFTLCSQNSCFDHCEKDERNENSTDISSCISTYAKLEDSPHFAFPTTFSRLNQGQAIGVHTYDVNERLMYPLEMKEYFSNQGVMTTNQTLLVKKIGPLTVEERRGKIEKYLQKRKQRSWNKKISYDCRKRVADGRLRIRGRFVTKSHAFALLEADGIRYDPNKITMGEIKEYLTKKFMEHPHNHESEKTKQFEEEFDFEKKRGEADGEMYYDIAEEFAMSPVGSDDGKCGFPYN